jgi:hypothetical protein
MNALSYGDAAVRDVERHRASVVAARVAPHNGDLCARERCVRRGDVAPSDVFSAQLQQLTEQARPAGERSHVRPARSALAHGFFERRHGGHRELRGILDVGTRRRFGQQDVRERAGTARLVPERNRHARAESNRHDAAGVRQRGHVRDLHARFDDVGTREAAVRHGGRYAHVASRW